MNPFRLPHFLQRFGFNNKLARYFDLCFCTSQIAKIFIKEKFEFIILCSGDRIDIHATHIAGKLTGTKLLPYYFDDYVFQWSEQFSRRLAQHIEKHMLRNSSMVFVPNEFMEEELKHRQPVVLASIVHNPANPETEISASIMKISYLDIRIVYTRAVYNINMAAFWIIIALNLITKARIGLYLYTAQSAELVKCEGISGDNIHIHNYASANETALALQQAVILLIPFSLGLSVPEAIKKSAPGKPADYLSSGAPILSFIPPNSFMVWVIKKHQCGIVVEKNDPNVLVNTMKNW